LFLSFSSGLIFFRGRKNENEPLLFSNEGNKKGLKSQKKRKKKEKAKEQTKKEW